jgi:hypothetical protein
MPCSANRPAISINSIPLHQPPNTGHITTHVGSCVIKSYIQHTMSDSYTAPSPSSVCPTPSRGPVTQYGQIIIISSLAKKKQTPLRKNTNGVNNHSYLLELAISPKRPRSCVVS